MVDPLGLDPIHDFGKGIGTYFKGFYGAGRDVARRTGLLGQCEKARVEQEDAVLLKLLNLYTERQEVRDLVAATARAYVRHKPWRFAGRATMATAVTISAMGFLGPAGGAFVATVVNSTATYGNLRLSTERGHEIVDAVRAILGGELPEGTGGRKDGPCP